MKIWSSFTPPQVVANLYEFLTSAEHKDRYLPLCSAEEKKTHTGLQQLEGE